MSLQVCHCGWSKVTSYQGLRTHQGKKGCTEKGLRIPQNVFKYNLTTLGPTFGYTFPPSLPTEGERIWRTVQEDRHQNDRLPLRSILPDQQNTFTNPPLPRISDAREVEALQMIQSMLETQSSLQSASNIHLNFHSDIQPIQISLVSDTPSRQANPAPLEVKNKATNLSVMENQKPSVQTATNSRESPVYFRSGAQPLQIPLVSETPSRQANPASVEVKTEATNQSIMENQQPSLQTAANSRESPVYFRSGAQPLQIPLVSETPSRQANPASVEVKTEATNQSIMENQQPSLQTAANSRSGAQPLQIPLVSETPSRQANPASVEVKTEATNQSMFETPPRVLDNGTRVRRALNFSSGAQQVEQLDLNVPTTTHQEVVRPKVTDREKEKEREKQKAKAKQDRIKAGLCQKIQMREQKTDEVRSSAKSCRGSLDAEWLEINNVFSDVIKVVEKARKKALQPLEERRQRVKAEERNLLQKLQQEIGKLKHIIDELDENQELQVVPPDEAWKDVTLDTSFSFGTLRNTTSNMKKKIDQKLEILSSVELKRIQKFAVNVKLDAATAHPCLDLSADGKQVSDSGENQRVTDSPERFDRFGSILGLNGLTSGKSYWEVEVRNKTGWDLGVTRANANRKGKLSLTPDDGYWVVVHYEGEKYAALSAPPTSLSLKQKPQKVGVFVDHQEGLVSFYDVTAQSHIYSFTQCLLNGEIFPYFSPHLRRNGENFDPLIISGVKKEK